MTTHTDTLSRVAASAAAVLVATLLAGCSSGGSVDDFCAGREAADEIMTSPDAGAPGSEEFEATMEELNDTMLAIEPPSEIEDDWEIGVAAMKKYADRTADLDVDDPADADELSRLSAELQEELTSDEYVESSERIAAFTAENCDA